MKLRIELVPSPLWGQSLKRTLPDAEWRRLRRWALDQAGNTCAPCGVVVEGGRGMICHEVWQYDDERCVQTLARLEIHCPACDRVTHIGHTATKLGPQAAAEARKRLAEVNGLTPQEAEAYRGEVWQAWRERSAKTWTQDLSWYQRWKESE